VVTSDDPAASERIASFAAGTSDWLVAVRMVSEGVDIPRLRVGVYATTTTTELFFRQAVGRFVRWEPGVRNQRAWLYVPDDPRQPRRSRCSLRRRPGWLHPPVCLMGRRGARPRTCSGRRTLPRPASSPAEPA